MGHATYVYVISGEHGRQKIGSSDDPRRRIGELQTGSPYKLHFEFIGETEARGAGAVEVQAHFMLHEHKAPGGDEWFVVPPDVAITAVMAAAHRLGYTVRPVDADKVAPKYPNLISGRAPAWVWVMMAPFILWLGHAFFFRLLPAYHAGRIGELDVTIGGFFYLLLLCGLRPIVTMLGVWTGIGPRLDPHAMLAALKAPWTEEQRY